MQPFKSFKNTLTAYFNKNYLPIFSKANFAFFFPQIYFASQIPRYQLSLAGSNSYDLSSIDLGNDQFMNIAGKVKRINDPVYEPRPFDPSRETSHSEMSDYSDIEDGIQKVSQGTVANDSSDDEMNLGYDDSGYLLTESEDDEISD